MKYCLLLILLLGGLYCSAQTHLPYRENGKWGLITPQKKVVLKPKYEYIFNYKDLDFTKFMQGGKYGILDLNGNVIVPAENNQIEILNEAFFSFKKEKGFGLKNAEGKIIIKPIFRKMESIREDLLLCENDSCKLLYNTDNFNEVWIKDLLIYPTSNLLILTKEDSCVVYDRDLNLVFQSGYRHYFPEDDGTFFTSDYGEYFLENEFNGTFKDSQKPMMHVNSQTNLFAVKDSVKFGVYDPIQKEYLIDPEYEWIEMLNEAFFKVKKGEKYGLIDNNAKWILEPIYADIFSLEDGFYVQNSDLRIGICDKNGRLIIPMKYDWISENPNHYQVANGNKIGIYSKGGRLIESPVYDEIRHVDGSFKCYAGPTRNAKGKVIKYKKVVSFDFSGGQVSGRVEFKDVGIINISAVNQNVRYTRDRLNIGMDSIYRWKRVERKFMIKGEKISAQIWGLRDSSLRKFVVKPKYDNVEVFLDRNYTLARKFNYGVSPSLNSPMDVLQHKGDYHLIDHDQINKYPKQSGFFSLSSIYKNSDVLETFMGDHFVFRSLDSARSWQYKYIDKVNDDHTRRAAITGVYEWCSDNDLLKLMDAREFIGRINSSYNDSVPTAQKNRLLFSVDFVNAPFKVKSGQWTLINEQHQRLTEINYDFIDNPVRGKYLSIYKGKWGVISQDSTCVPHLYHELTRLRSKKDDVLLSANKQFVQSLVDSMGNKVEVPDGRKIMQREGNAVLFMENGKYGLLDSELNVLVSAEHGRLKYMDFGWYRFRKRGKMGLLTADGQIIPPKFKELELLNADYIVFNDRRLKGVMNFRGDTIVAAEFDEFQLADKVLIGKQKGDFYVINFNGKHQKVKGDFNGSFGAYLVFSTPQGVILTDKKGKKVAKFSKTVLSGLNNNRLHLFDDGSSVVYNENLEKVYENKEHLNLLEGDYYYQSKDKEKIVLRFASRKTIDAGSIMKVKVYDDLLVYKANGRYRILNTKTHERFIFPEEVAKVLSFHGDHFRVFNKDRTQAYFDLEAKNIYHRKFDFTRPFQDGYAIVKDKNEAKIFYQNGTMIEGLVYHKMIPLIGGYFNAQILKSYGLVSETEGELIKPEYDKIRFSSGNLVQLIKDGDVFYYDFDQQKMIK